MTRIHAKVQKAKVSASVQELLDAFGPQTTAPGLPGKSESSASSPTSVSSSPSPVGSPLSSFRSHENVAAYSHQAMVDLMVDHPEFSHLQLCDYFGKPQSWLASVLASEAFQQVLDLRRHEVLDPSLTATIQERFKALAIRTTDVILERLDKPEVDSFLLIRASEISIKAICAGQKTVEAPPALPPASTNTLAERILAMMDKANGANTLDGEVTDVTIRHGDV